MDDPWRSPWNATDTDADKDQTSPSPAKSDLALPPRALLSASSSPRLPAVQEPWSWGDDSEGFGDWAAAPAGSDSASISSGWGGGWGAASPNLAPARRDPSPIPWPANIASPKPTNGLTFRQPSPDPWASELSFQRETNDETPTPRVVIDVASPTRDAHFETPASDGFGVSLDSVWDGDHVEEETDKIRVDASAFTEAAHHDAVRLEVEVGTQRRESRSPTPSNENTDHEDDRQDSPITSIDEDSRGRQRESRKPPGKVKELVVKFDGLARALSQESLPVPRTRSKSPLSVEKKETQNADLGDFEAMEEQEVVKEVELPTPPSPLAHQRPSTPEPSESAPQDVAASVSSATSSPAASTNLPFAGFSPTNLEVPTFELPLDNIDKIFANLDLAAAAAPIDDDGELPEPIITDSFTEISERKTWYRVSRLGSSRRQNAGDDDSYRRITWRTSTVRKEVITTVRRWMEEDSIAGRVALGGGISKTQKNMFGWDSSAEPIALDAVFGRRKAHSRTASLEPIRVPGLAGPIIEGPPKTTSGSLQTPTFHSAGMAPPPVASFGWSSSPPVSQSPTPTAARFPRPGHQATAPVRPFSPVHHTPGPSQPTAALPNQRVPPPIVTEPHSNPHLPLDEDDEDDDDEWGEMVSSPVVSKPGANGFQTLGGAFTTDPATTTNGVGGQGTSSSNLPASSDPWASADFSFFDAPSGPAQSAASAHVPSASVGANRKDAFSPIAVSFPLSLSETPRGSLDTKAALSLSQPTLQPPVIQPFTTITAVPAAKSSLSRDSVDMAGAETTQLDECAERILVNLPDLSYMLR
ncbi:hypothetical protein QBC35DRAFT_385839 [Podospora australis]|uniref:Glucan 1, 4-alpha-glucosidase n=1 Tax=Podospora australis TaxID=1536484 RepID=A0AAN6WV27_9PEZI|nr:hypothetical protein QBC35DRAFT_385839 [Podospora australis]